VALSRGFGQYQLHLPVDTWVDLEAAASAIDEAEGALRAGYPGRILGPATVAATIAGRPFLSGVEGEWVESQRRKLERQLLRALDCLSSMWLDNKEPALAVETATARAAAAVRRSDGPYFLELRTYRYRAHSMADPELYRTKAEVEEWRKRDPIAGFVAQLKQRDLLDEAESRHLLQLERDEKSGGYIVRSVSH